MHEVYLGHLLKLNRDALHDLLKETYFVLAVRDLDRNAEGRPKRCLWGKMISMLGHDERERMRWFYGTYSQQSAYYKLSSGNPSWSIQDQRTQYKGQDADEHMRMCSFGYDPWVQADEHVSDCILLFFLYTLI